MGNCAHVGTTGWGEVSVCVACTTCVVVSANVNGLVEMTLLWLGQDLRWCRVVRMLVHLLAFVVDLVRAGMLAIVLPVSVCAVVVGVVLL
jgi:hypothetical protein